MVILTVVIALPLLEFFVFAPEGISLFSEPEAAMDLILTPRAVLLFLALQNSLLIILIYIRVFHLGRYKAEDIGITTQNSGRLILEGLAWGLIIIAIMTALSYALAYAGLETEAPFGIPDAPPELILILVGGVIFAPIGEELFFRAYIFTAVKARYNVYFAYTFSALFFAVSHFSLVEFLPILLMGIFLAFIFDRYKNIIPCIIIHALNNFIVIMAIYYTQ